MTTETSQKKTVLIVGASRGLGMALAAEYLRRGWHVIATIRQATGSAEFQALQATASAALEVLQLEMTSSAQIDALGRRLEGRAIDLLFVNAGIANGPAERVCDASTEEFVRLMVTNTLGPWRVIERLVERVVRGGSVAVMSSGLGSVTNNTNGGWEVYRASKAALNTLMRSFAARHADDGRTYLVIAPGWVRTDMGGPNAFLDIETGIPGVVDAIAQRSGAGGVTYVNYQNQILPWKFARSSRQRAASSSAGAGCRIWIHGQHGIVSARASRALTNAVI